MESRAAWPADYAMTRRAASPVVGKPKRPSSAEPSPRTHLQQSGKRVRGIALVAAATVVWSTGGLFVRFLDLDLWTMQAWRALFSALSLLVVVIIDKGGQAPKAFYDMGRLGLLAAPVAAVSMICFVAALKLTTVANVMVIYATVPFVAAGVAYLWVREKIERRTLIASLGALFGIAIMAGSATRPSDLAGNAL